MSKRQREQTKVSQCLQLALTQKRNDKQSGLQTAESIVRNRLMPDFGHLPADAGSFPHESVQNYKQKRSDEGAKPSTVNGELAILRRGLILGARMNFIAKAPYIPLYHIGNSNRRLGFFEADEFTNLRQHMLRDTRNVVTFIYFTGWREGEVLGLKRDNYDKAGKVMRLWASKNGRGRVFPLDIIPELDQLVNQQEENLTRDCDWLFPWQHRRYRYETFYRHWKRACVEAGIDRLPHDFRRTAVRNLIRAGVPVQVAMEITGHKTQSVFYRYDIINEGDLREAVTKYNNYLQQRHSTSNENTRIEVVSNRMPFEGNTVTISTDGEVIENPMPETSKSGIELGDVTMRLAREIKEVGGLKDILGGILAKLTGRKG